VTPVALEALVGASAYSGAALYAIIAEHAARIRLAPAAAIAQWQASARRGFYLRAFLAAVGGFAGLWAWRTGGNGAFLAGSLVLLASWPWTAFAMGPISRRLIAIDANAEDAPEFMALLARWGRFAVVRLLLGVVATILFATALPRTSM